MHNTALTPPPTRTTTNIDCDCGVVNGPMIIYINSVTWAVGVTPACRHAALCDRRSITTLSCYRARIITSVVLPGTNNKIRNRVRESRSTKGEEAILQVGIPYYPSIDSSIPSSYFNLGFRDSKLHLWDLCGTSSAILQVSQIPLFSSSAINFRGFQPAVNALRAESFWLMIKDEEQLSFHTRCEWVSSLMRLTKNIKRILSGQIW